MDQPPAVRAASKRRRNRRRRQRRRRAAAATATGPGSDVPAAERGGTAQGSAAAAASSSSRRRDPWPWLRRDRAAIAKAKAEASRSPGAHVSETCSGKTDAQGGLHDTTNCVSDVVSVQVDSSLQSGGCLDTGGSRCSANLPQSATKKTRKSNLKADNNTTKVYPGDWSASYSLSCENSVGETEDLRSKFFKQSDVTCQLDNCTASENADTCMGYQSEDPKCPVMRKTNLSGNSKEASPDCRSLQELEECKENEKGDSINSSNPKEENKKSKKRKGRNRRKRSKNTSSQDCPLSNRAEEESSFVVLVSEKNASCHSPVTNSVSVVDAKTKEGESVNMDSTIDKRCELGSSTDTETNKFQKQDIEFPKDTGRNAEEESSFVVLISEKYASCHSPVTNLLSVVDAKTKEGESVNLDSTIYKRCELGSSTDTERNSTIDKRCELGSSTDTERNKCQKQGIAFSEDSNTNFQNLAESHAEKLNIAVSPGISFIGFPKKKLLILDLNGILADINQDLHNAYMADAKVRGKLVFRRPYCEDFLKFCSWNFDLGIWSSRKKENVASVLNIIMRDFRPPLLFCWDMSKCTFTGCKTLDNKHKPLVLKELRKLWNKEDPDLPWEEGDYSPSNTILVDDSPYKALLNPPHTAVFPRPYSYLNWNDNSLGMCSGLIFLLGMLYLNLFMLHCIPNKQALVETFANIYRTWLLQMMSSLMSVTIHSVNLSLLRVIRAGTSMLKLLAEGTQLQTMGCPPLNLPCLNFPESQGGHYIGYG